MIDPKSENELVSSQSVSHLTHKVNLFLPQQQSSRFSRILPKEDRDEFYEQSRSEEQRWMLPILIHEEIRLPPVVNHANKMLNEEQMIRLLRFSGQPHAGLFRRAIALAVVAPHAGASQIFP